MEISNKVKSISPSLTLAISAKANELKAQGKSIISFSVGEPDFNTPDYIIQSAHKALDEGKTKYTPSSGLVDLKKQICEKFKKENNLEYAPSQIVVSNGAKHSIFNALFCMLNEGDEVIIPSPYWLTYPESVKVCGGVCKFVETTEEQDYKMTPEQLESAITPKTKCLILNSPSNPTGSVYTEDEIKALAKVIEKYDFYVLSDEIYEKLVYADAKHISIASVSEKMKERTVVINGMSKAFAMTGWRIGYLAGPQNLIKAIDSFQSHATSNACSISQVASITALSNSGEDMEKMRQEFDARRQLIIKEVRKIDGITCNEPTGAFYVMVNVSKLYGKKYNGETLSNSQDFCTKLLDFGVAAVPGLAFGVDNYIRLSYATSRENIVEGVARLDKFVKSLN